MSITIVKLGGSLMRGDELPVWLEAIQSLAAKENIVIVPGGGQFADKVRELQVPYKFNDQTAHNMALLAMCQYAYLLADIAPELQTTSSIDVESIFHNKAGNNALLWLPLELLGKDTVLPASWDYTSDSIALWLAIKLTAARLLLVKSKKMDSALSIEKHIKNNDLDKGFKTLVTGYHGEISLLEKGEYELLTNL